MPTLAQKLRETNRRLRFCLDSIFAQPDPPAVATPEQMATLLSELLRTGASLRADPLPMAGDDPELNLELDQYRSNVERLRKLLPSIHSQLLAERARLEGQRARVQSAVQWARASRQAF
jgi:hypothetical protein